MEKEISKLICQILDIEDNYEFVELKRSNFEDRWDSLKHLEIIFAAEAKYKLHFEDNSELYELDSAEKLMAAVLKRAN